MEAERDRLGVKFRVGLIFVAIGVVMFVWGLWFATISYTGQTGSSDISLFTYHPVTSFFALLIGSIIFIVGAAMMAVPKRRTEVVYVSQPVQPQRVELYQEGKVGPPPP